MGTDECISQIIPHQPNLVFCHLGGAGCMAQIAVFCMPIFCMLEIEVPLLASALSIELKSVVH